MGPSDYRAARARTYVFTAKWLGVEGSNPHYQGQNLASYH